jgi:transcriptional regulator with XRE-family HTH domain
LKITYQYGIIKWTREQVEKFQLGPFLKKLRELQNLSTRELAQRSRAKGRDSAVAHSQISNIENGKNKPEFQTLQNIAAALGRPLTIVLDGSQADLDTVTILSTDDIANDLVAALRRPEVVELLMYCIELTDEQSKAVLEVARSIHGFTRPLEELSESTQVINKEGEE